MYSVYEFAGYNKTFQELLYPYYNTGKMISSGGASLCLYIVSSALHGIWHAQGMVVSVLESADLTYTCVIVCNLNKCCGHSICMYM